MSRKDNVFKTPLLLQVEAVECGAAALGIILAYYGKYLTLETLRIDCGVSRDGSKAGNMLQAGRKHGLEGKGESRELDHMKCLSRPVIIFWEFNHFLVVEGYRSGKFYLNDPALGRRSVSEAEFSESFTGIVLDFEPAPNFEKGGRKYNVVRDIKKWIRGSESSFALLFLVSMTLSVPLVMIPLFSRFYVDYILIRQNVSWMSMLVIAVTATLLLMVVSQAMISSVVRRMQVKLSVRMSYLFLSKLMQMPMQFYFQRDKAELAARMEYCDVAAQIITGPFVSSFISVFNLLLFTLALLLFQPILALLAIVLSTVVFFGVYAIAKRNEQNNILLVKEKNALSAATINGITLIDTIKATGRESEYFEKWSGVFTKVANAEFEAGRYYLLSSALPFFMSHLTTITLLIVGSIMVMQGELTIGGLVGVIALVQGVTSSMMGLTDLGRNIQLLSASFRAINDVYDYTTGNTEQYTGDTSSPVNTPNTALQNVSFGYSLLAPPMIHDISIELQKGKSYAFVGKSGSGKSTVAKLLTGLYRPWTGRVVLEGKDIREYSTTEIAGKISVVEQQIFLFHGTIRKNITLWKKEVDGEEIIEACKTAEIHEEISSKPGGYNYPLEENARNLSGGQRQRIEIARCLIGNPDLIIFDEATSALDESLERRIMQNLKSKTCTKIFISHRLSTMKDCDEIIVFDKGVIVERGGHDELMQKRGHYMNLVQSADV